MPIPVRYSTRANLENEEILVYVFKHFEAENSDKGESTF